MGGKGTEGTKGTQGTQRTEMSPAFWSFGSFPWSLPGAGGETGAGHALAQATLSEKSLFQPAELLVEEVVSHFDQAHNHIDADRGVGVLDALFESVVICPGHTVELPQAADVAVFARPFLKAAVAHEIPVVFQQFLLAGAGDVR